MGEVCKVFIFVARDFKLRVRVCLLSSVLRNATAIILHQVCLVEYVYVTT